jgi:hemoglobin/transferrin/lactoferrin receptor protein
MSTLLANPAAAQTGQPATSGLVALSIPAQPLRSAVNAFIRATGWQTGYPSRAEEGRTTQPVFGSMPPQQALSIMLAGTGLVPRFTGPRSAALVDGMTSDMVPTSLERQDGDSTLLEDIEVIGTRSVTAADAPYLTPGSSSHISAEQINRIPPTNPGDIFRSTPGVIASGNRIGTSLNVNIRGLQGQSRVNVMVDGTRQTGGTYRGYSGARDEVFVDPDFLAGVDIEKGPSGGVGGAGAMGGVVNLRTIDARDVVKEGQTYGAKVKASFGSGTKSPPDKGEREMRNGAPGFINGDAWSGSMAAGVSEDAYDVVAAFSRRRSGNYFAGEKGKSTFRDDRNPLSPPVEKALAPFGPGDEVFNTSQDVTSFLVKGGVRWGDGHSAKLGYTRYENRYGENYETLLNFALPGPFPVPADQRALGKTTTDTFTSEYRWDPAGNDLIKLASHLWASDLRSRSDVARELFADPRVDGRTHAKSYGGDISNVSSFETPAGQLTIKNGGEFVIERARGEPVDLGFALYSFNPTGNRELASAFNQSKIDVTDWLSFSGGLRYDYFWSKGVGDIAAAIAPKMKGGRLSPSASVTVTPVQGLQVFAAYTEGWRPPSLRESAAFGAGGITNNPDLKPETSKNVEFGVNVARDDLLRDGDRARLKLARFDNRYDDYIRRTRDPATFIYSWSNIDKARFKGFELSAEYAVGFAFAEAAFTRFDKVRFCDGGMCDFSVVGTDYGVQTIPPKYTATLTGGVRLLDRKLTLGSRLYFIGERFGGYPLAPAAVNPPTYWAKNTIFDLFGSYKFTDDVSLDLALENVGDRYYLDPLAAGLVPSPGRTFRTSLSARF